MNVFYEKSKMPICHPKWFVKGTRVISPHNDYHGTVLGFCYSDTLKGEDGVVKTDRGLCVVTEMTSDFKKE